MRSHLLTAILFFTCSSFLLKDNTQSQSKTNERLLALYSSRNAFDFSVHRVSGKKVILSWHTQDEEKGVVYEVLRKPAELTQFISLGKVKPKYENGSWADYVFIDANDYTSTSYYCLKKTNADSVIFYSVTKKVVGVAVSR